MYTNLLEVVIGWGYILLSFYSWVANTPARAHHPTLLGVCVWWVVNYTCICVHSDLLSPWGQNWLVFHHCAPNESTAAMSQYPQGYQGFCKSLSWAKYPFIYSIPQHMHTHTCTHTCTHVHSHMHTKKAESESENEPLCVLYKWGVIKIKCKFTKYLKWSKVYAAIYKLFTTQYAKKQVTISHRFVAPLLCSLLVNEFSCLWVIYGRTLYNVKLEILPPSFLQVYQK